MVDSKSQRHCVDGRSHRNDQRGISSWLKKRRNRDYIAVRNRPVSGIENFPLLMKPHWAEIVLGSASASANYKPSIFFDNLSSQLKTKFSLLPEYPLFTLSSIIPHDISNVSLMRYFQRHGSRKLKKDLEQFQWSNRTYKS